MTVLTKMIGFLTSTNSERTKTFYGDVLGFKLLGEDDFALVFDANGTMLRVLKAQTFTAAKGTVIGWQVDDIYAAVEELSARGVRFEQFNLPFMKQDARGVWTPPSGDQVAWFKDPDGNVLSISHHASAFQRPTKPLTSGARGIGWPALSRQRGRSSRPRRGDKRQQSRCVGVLRGGTRIAEAAGARNHLKEDSMTRLPILASVAVALTLALSTGCDKGADDQQKANAAQAEADKKIADAKKDAADKASSAQAEADKKIAAAENDFGKRREDYRHKLQSDVVDLDKKIDLLEAKAKAATGKAKTDLELSLAPIRTRRAAFAADLASIPTTNAMQWDATKARVEKDWTDLKSIVDKASLSVVRLTSRDD